MNDHAAHSSARTSKLNVLGLGEVDAAVYQILLQTPHRAPDDLADHLNTSSEAICRALGNLERLSLVRPSPKHPGAHRSVSPEVGLAALLDKHEADLVRRYREVDETRRAINSLAADYAQWRAARSKGETEIIDTIDDGHDQLENLTAGAQTEILSFRPGVFTPGAMDVCRAVDTDRIKPHVKRRTLYLDSINNSADGTGYVRQLIAGGADVRVTPVLPSFMVVFDARVAVLPVDVAEPRRVMVIRSEGVLSVLIDHFEQVWSGALPFGSAEAEPDATPASELSATELAVLKMLASGFTDEAVARRLDVSLRTVRRMMSRLMKMLGTRSRFETGARAAERGWI